MKVSDYIVKYLEDMGVDAVFYLSGGMIMHLVDSLHKSTKIKPIHVLNEQCAVVAADAYAQYTGRIGVALVTSGPGATNAITGVAASYIDSTPLLIISGQCKTPDMKVNERSKGCQEVDIINMVKPITKAAISRVNHKTIKTNLDYLVNIATTGRKGPVWLDIPIDVQAEVIDE